MRSQWLNDQENHQMSAPHLVQFLRQNALWPNVFRALVKNASINRTTDTDGIPLNLTRAPFFRSSTLTRAFFVFWWAKHSTGAVYFRHRELPRPDRRILGMIC